MQEFKGQFKQKYPVSKEEKEARGMVSKFVESVLRGAQPDSALWGQLTKAGFDIHAQIIRDMSREMYNQWRTENYEALQADKAVREQYAWYKKRTAQMAGSSSEGQMAAQQRQKSYAARTGGTTRVTPLGYTSPYDVYRASEIENITERIMADYYYEPEKKETPSYPARIYRREGVSAGESAMAKAIEKVRSLMPETRYAGISMTPGGSFRAAGYEPQRQAFTAYVQEPAKSQPFSAHVQEPTKTAKPLTGSETVGIKVMTAQEAEAHLKNMRARNSLKRKLKV